MIHYFAYGSNLHPVRLTERVPSAVYVGPCSLPGHRLAFHKRGQDDSGKCNMVRTEKRSDRVLGALYRIASYNKVLLDGFEGKGYQDTRISVNLGGQTIDCYTYYARDCHIENDLKPFHWYKSLVILGALFHGFPTSYIAATLDVASIPDMDEGRKQQNLDLIARLSAHTRR